MRTGRIVRPLAVLLAAACLAAAGAGCGLVETILGTESGYLFLGYDTLALPGEKVPVKVRLESGELLRDRPGVAIHFSCDKCLNRLAVTDGEGYAVLPFTPPAPGDYEVTASVFLGPMVEPPPEPVRVLVACRTADAPMAVVDLDKTLVASGFKTVLVGDPQPMPGSQEAMARLAREFTPVYLTHRLDYLGPKTKAWLQANGYPRGPVLLADVRAVFERSGTFKSAVLAGLRRRFHGRAIGIGDKVSDALAYTSNGLEAFLLLRVPPGADASVLRDMAASLARLPDSVQVVEKWDQIEQAVAGRAAYPRVRVQADLRRRADVLDGRT
jgi:hypothetical protein